MNQKYMRFWSDIYHVRAMISKEISQSNKTKIKMSKHLQYMYYLLDHRSEEEKNVLDLSIRELLILEISTFFSFLPKIWIYTII